MADLITVGDYPADSWKPEPGLNYPLREISAEEVDRLNNDLHRLVAVWSSPVMRDQVVEYSELIFAVVRAVMHRANQGYAGPTDLGEGVVVDWLRAADLDRQQAPVANTWDHNPVTAAAGDLYGTDGARVTMTVDREAQIHFGFHVVASQPTMEAVQYIKGGKTFRVNTLYFEGLDPDQQIALLRAPMVFLPGESFNMDARFARGIAATVRCIGLRIVTSDQINTL